MEPSVKYPIVGLEAYINIEFKRLIQKAESHVACDKFCCKPHTAVFNQMLHKYLGIPYKILVVIVHALNKLLNLKVFLSHLKISSSDQYFINSSL